jgi:hypothetical protein
MKSETRYILMGFVALVVFAAIIAFLVPGDKVATDAALNKLKIATGYTLLALIFLLGFAVLVNIASGNIDLSELLSETDSKGASMSRFQLLIFTLVIALSLFLVVVSNMKFPDSIPPEILTLLGISASTYAVSKGIQVGGKPTQTPPSGTPSPGATPPPDTPASRAATVGGGSDA